MTADLETISGVGPMLAPSCAAAFNDGNKAMEGFVVQNEL